MLTSSHPVSHVFLIPSHHHSFVYDKSSLSLPQCTHCHTWLRQSPDLRWWPGTRSWSQVHHRYLCWRRMEVHNDNKSDQSWRTNHIQPHHHQNFLAKNRILPALLSVVHVVQPSKLNVSRFTSWNTLILNFSLSYYQVFTENLVEAKARLTVQAGQLWWCWARVITTHHHHHHYCQCVWGRYTDFGIMNIYILVTLIMNVNNK